MKFRRIALVDDHHLFRAGVKMLLEDLGGYQVVAEASTASQALSQFPNISPDVVFVDVSLPDMSGIELIRCLHEVAWTGTIPKYVILSMHSQREFVVRSFEAGAAGYLLKESAPEQLELALEKIAVGEHWVSEQLGSYQDYLGVEDECLNLTTRQIEVLRLLASGHNVKSIAYELEISPKTVQTFRSQIMQRLHLSDFAALVRFAIRHGIVSG